MAVTNILTKYRKSAVIITTIMTLAGVITATNVIFGLNVRPAWAFELVSLNVNQLELQIRQLNSDRREFNRDLAKYKAMREEFRNNGQPVPVWLTEAIADAESDITKIDERKGSAQKQIIQLKGN